MLTQRTTFLFCLLMLLSSTVFGQMTNIEKLEALEFRTIGPHRGGRVTTVAGIPGDMFTYYMGATGGGVWKTTDGGLSWNNISDGFFETGSIGAIAIAPSDKNVVYVGTGAADLRGNVSAGKGIYKSTDAGESWTHIGLPRAGQIAKIEVHPANPELVYVAVLGNAFGRSTERGVYRSEDGGKNWKQVLFKSSRTGAVDLVMNPDNPRVLYAGLWTAERKPWTLIDGSEEGGVWKTTDGGDTWTQLTNGLPTGEVGRVGIAVSPVNPQKIWVLQEAKEETKGGLYRSDDGGKSFKRINRDHNLRQRAWYYTRVFADPQNENTLYIANVSFYKSIDGGKTTQRVRSPHSDHHALWIQPDNPNVMILGNDGGATITVNGGKTWTTQLNQPTAEFYRVSTDEQFPYRVYGAQQDNTTLSVPSKFKAEVSPEQEWYTVGGGESGHIAVHPRDPDIIYAGTYIGQITRMDKSKGHTKDIVAYPQMHDGVAPRDIRFRFQWNAPIRMSPHNPDIVYHCSQYVHRTTDGGQTWEVISPDLTTNNDQYHNIPGGPIQHDHTGVELYTTIFAFEESPLETGVLWAGSDDGLLHISRNGGTSWQNITPPRMPTGGTINTIELSAHAPGRAIISVYKYRENDFRPYVFLTDNYGLSWRSLTNGSNGIPADHFVRVVREDPVRKGLLYAGTEYGMYISFDEGNSWQAFQLNLPVVPITDMQVKNDDLVLSTQGRSFWILDDLTPLRRWDTNVLIQDAFLFAPRIAYRTQLRNYYGDNVPDPAPNGALINFYIKNTPPADSLIKLEILDTDGTVRKTYSSQPKKKEQKLSVQEGLNRLEWNLRYERPEVLKDAVFSLASTSGVKAVPGPHTVRLTVGSQVFEEYLDIKTDPRWTQSDEELSAQYELSMKIKALLNECHGLIDDMRYLRKQINIQTKNLKQFGVDSTSFFPVAENMLKQLEDMEEQLKQNKSESGQDPINYPPMLDDQIAYLYSFVNGQDNMPNEGAYRRFEDLSLQFSRFKQQFDVLRTNEVGALNRELKAANLPHILLITEK